jgi:signal peptide peptidase SppA
MRALEAALNAVWAMEEGALETLLSVAARENLDVTPEALEAYRAKTLESADRATVRDGVAIIDVRGSLFKRANFFTAISGATSYDTLRRDFQAALDDRTVNSILLNIDSPGGEASGTAELAQAIYGARGKKPVTAYVGGMGASAAYWIASAADKIVVDPTALLGSIGVQMGMRVSGEPKDGSKAYRFVSSQSPDKNAGPETEAGAKGIQKMVDAMAQVFVENVARNRGVDTETVLNNFGKGGIFVGKDAVEAGLADSLGNFESVLAELSSGSRSTRSKGMSMSEIVEKPAATVEVVDVAAQVAAAVAADRVAERTRIAGLNKMAKSFGVADDALSTAINDGTTVEAFGLAAADVVAAANAKRIEVLKADETKVAEVKPSTAPLVEQTDASAADKLAAEIAGFAPPSATAEK